MNLQELNKEAHWLIYKYNEYLLDNNIKDKSLVRDWFYAMTQPLIVSGIPSFTFLYCELTLGMTIDKLKEFYKISDSDDKKYYQKYGSLELFESIRKSFYNE